MLEARQLWSTAVTACATLITISFASAQTVTLKVHHFLPSNSTVQRLLIEPWCEKISTESSGRLKCQLYPSMQLGGSPPQLFDQARDGIADIVWTIPTYQAGRFTKSEVFELPFMTKSSAGTRLPARRFFTQVASVR